MTHPHEKSAVPRKIEHHLLDGAHDHIQIDVLDAPGAGGASHVYRMWFDTANPEAQNTINFQKGPIFEAGANGITHEALIAILIDRLDSFQAGDYPCKENACAKTHLEEALMWLQKRTLNRRRRGVEGQSKA